MAEQNYLDQVIRTELRLRYYVLTQQNFRTIEQQLNFNQLKALRFASDEEFLNVLQQTIRENLPPSTIKKLIKRFEPG